MEMRNRQAMTRNISTAPGPAATIAAEFEPLSEIAARLGESPVWDAGARVIWWVDIDGQRLLRTMLDGATTAWPTPEVPGFVQCVDGSLFVGMQSGIFRFDPQRGSFQRCAALSAPGMRFNDSCVDARGRIWAGTMDLENRRANGVLYLFDPATGRLAPRLEGFRTINGLAWDAARQRLYLSDSHPTVQAVWTCAMGPDDRLAEPRLFAAFDALEGRPDGALIDAAGTYWIAGVGGAVLHRFAPDATRLGSFRVPQRDPTKPALLPAVTPDADGPAMVLTSRDDERLGGRLAIWRAPPLDGLEA